METQTRVLTTKDRNRWHEVLANADFRDVNWLPEYMELFETERSPAVLRSFGGQGLLYVYGDRNNLIFYPFFKRSLSSLPFADSQTSDLYDIISPYGYGGPIAHFEDTTLADQLWTGFVNGFHEYCVRSKIVSEFCRLHPVFENHKPMARYSEGQVDKLGEICYVDLGLPVESILKSMIHGHRRRIHRALGNPELHFACADCPSAPSDFFQLYEETMKRRNAHEKYFFSESFFGRCFDGLKSAMNYCTVEYRDQIIASWIVTRYGDVAYAWLSGANPEYFSLFATNLLIYRSILKLKEEGAKILILGGGKSVKHDSVFQFKAGFSPLMMDFYVYKKVHMPEEYARLVALQGSIASGDGTFFPAYRSYEDVNAPAGAASAAAEGGVDR